MAEFNLGAAYKQSGPFDLCKLIPQLLTILELKKGNKTALLINQQNPPDLGRCWGASLEHLRDVLNRFMSYKTDFQLLRSAAWFIKVDDSLTPGNLIFLQVDFSPFFLKTLLHIPVGRSIISVGWK